MTSKRFWLAMAVALNAGALAAQTPAPPPQAKTNAPAPKPVEDPRFAWQETPDHPRPKVDTPEPQYLYPETPEDIGRHRLQIYVTPDRSTVPPAVPFDATVEIDEEVPPEHYKAVAEVICYVMRLRGAVRS